MRKFKRKQKKQIAVLTLIVLVASIVAIMLLTPGFDIKKINVHGNVVVTEEEIIFSSGIVNGENIFSVSLSQAKDSISSMGYIESVKIKRKLPSTIEITVVEEVGVGYIKAKEGYVIITAAGKCIDITDGIKDDESGNASLPDIPAIKGLKNVKYKLGSVLKSDDERKLKALFACLHEFARQGYVFDMREIDVTDTDNIKFYYMTKDLCVSVGKAEKIDYKMECFAPILKEIGENPKGYIDLERLTYRKPEVKTETKTEE